MRFEYPRWLVFFTPGIALVFPVSLLFDIKLTSISDSAWIALACFGVIVGTLTAYLRGYSIAVDGDELLVSGFRHRSFKISQISSLSVTRFWHRMSAVVEFASGELLSVPGGLQDFENLIQLLKFRAPNAKFQTDVFP